jgi:hypothetical protein
MRRLALSALISLFVFSYTPAQAQRIFTFGVGAGAGVGKAGDDTDGGLGHGLGFIELKPPLFPFGARATGLLLGGAGDAGPFGATISALGSLPLPLIMPYTLAGWGRYGIGGDDSRDGWHVGVGVRVSRLFVEVQRHERLGRNLVTLGITF